MNELDEFPDDVEQTVTDLLLNWRKGEHFPNSLGESFEKVEEIEQLYKAKVFFSKIVLILLFSGG